MMIVYDKPIILMETFDKANRKLTQQEQERVREFLWEFNSEKKGVGKSFERLHGKNQNLWSARISDDLRVIVHQGKDSWNIMYIDHHDAAYRWAERKRVLENEQGGLRLQQIEWEIIKQKKEVIEHAFPPLFSHLESKYFQELGFPEISLSAIYAVRTEEQLIELLEDFPNPLACILLDLYEGKIIIPKEAKEIFSHFSYSKEEGESMNSAPLDEEEIERVVNEDDLTNWVLYVPEEQQVVIDAEYSQPVWLNGAAGTGKSVVALHRARKIAREEQNVVILSTSKILLDQLSADLDFLCRNEIDVRQKIQCVQIEDFIFQFAYQYRLQKPPNSQIKYQQSRDIDKKWNTFVRSNLRPYANKISIDWYIDEWNYAINQCGCIEWDDYKKTFREGREIALTTKEKIDIWSYIRTFRIEQLKNNTPDMAYLCLFAINWIKDNGIEIGHIIVDEVQDLNNAQLRFIEELYSNGQGTLLLTGDVNQRLFQSKLNVDKLNISFQKVELHTCYRTTEFIRRYAEQVLATKSIITSHCLEVGKPVLECSFDDQEQEAKTVVEQIQKWTQEGISYNDIVILRRLKKRSDILFSYMEKYHSYMIDNEKNKVRMCSFFSAKGIEFDAVIVLGAEEGLVPFFSSQKMSQIDSWDYVQRERKKLYVALSRPRKELMVTWVGKKSYFLK